MDLVAQITTTLTNIPEPVWGLILTALGVSSVQAAAVGKIKTKVDTISPKTNILITVALSAIGAACAQFNHLIASDPQSFGTATAGLVGAAQPIYRFAVQPFTLWLSALLADARSYRASKDAHDTIVASTVAAPAQDSFLG